MSCTTFGSLAPGTTVFVLLYLDCRFWFLLCAGKCVMMCMKWCVILVALCLLRESVAVILGPATVSNVSLPSLSVVSTGGANEKKLSDIYPTH